METELEIAGFGHHARYSALSPDHQRSSVNMGKVLETDAVGIEVGVVKAATAVKAMSLMRTGWGVR